MVIESDGSIAGKYRKMHIPDDPAYYEKFYFTPGDLGFHPIDTSVGRLGVLVCCGTSGIQRQRGIMLGFTCCHALTLMSSRHGSALNCRFCHFN